MRSILTSFLALTLCISAAQAQSRTSGTAATLNDPNKKAVEDFGLAVIGSYCDQTFCNYLYDRLHTTILSMETGQSFQKNAALKNDLCASNPLRTDMSVTMQSYRDNHQWTVLSAAEFRQNYSAIATQIQMQDGDYFFNGAQMKEGNPHNNSVFRASDMARFVVRKINGEWKIVAM